MTDKHKVYLGLGSNLGDREDIIRKAISLIGERVGLVIRQSSLIETEPWGFASEHPFLNAVALFHTTLSPRELLVTTQAIERELGRKEKSVSHYADRPIDIDILLYGDEHIDEPDLKIPHPLMGERDFVMRPLHEIQNHS
jgi:2-amino-4-hydroxy-6-hydroxymethyldihydropteridine diphosphokinase